VPLTAGRSPRCCGRAADPDGTLRCVAGETLYEHLGGDEALGRFVDALDARCRRDPELQHPFANALNPFHTRNLTWYLAEVFGGPPRYSTDVGNHSSMLGLHSGEDAPASFFGHFVDCFMAAADDAALPSDARFRAALRDYIEWSVADVATVNGRTHVPTGRRVPRWGWDGLVVEPT
jgi:hemoglobin